MPQPDLFDALLDAWDRNNTITINLLRAVADDAMDLKPIDTVHQSRSCSRTWTTAG